MRARNITVSCGAWASGRYISCDGSDASVLLTSPTTPTIRSQFLPLSIEILAPTGSACGKNWRAIESLMTMTGSRSAMSRSSIRRPLISGIPTV